MPRSLQVCAFVFICLVGSGRAHGDVQDWQINEVMTNLGGDDQIRYVELRNDVGGCFFPSSRIEAFDADGSSVGGTSPFAVTTCFGPNTYFLFATPAAASALGTTADRSVVPTLPTSAGQVCFISSTTRYDCVRWGAITTAQTDLFGSADSSAVAPHPSGMALERVATTHVVSADWQADSATPRGPNDGTPWFPPDAGPMPDAGPIIDAIPAPDAERLPDALPPPDSGPSFDASPNRFLDLDPRGGAACSCHGGAGGPAAVWLIAAATLVACGRRRSPKGCP